jgi:hypothetical protein
MATKRPTTPSIKAINILPQIPSAESKKTKPGGKKYDLVKAILIPVYLKKMQPHITTLVECNDGWFQVFENNKKKHFRMGPALVAEVSDSIKEIQ